MASNRDESGKRPIILLVEDDERNASFLAEYLESKNCCVSVASNGWEAIERVREKRPDLILMDIQIPEMDGLEVMRRLREGEARPDIPIIALTALAMPGDRERCLAAGADEYMSKPVDLQGLAKLVADYTANGRKEDGAGESPGDK